jgi:hypothetical protein
MRARVPSACLAWAALLALGAWNTVCAKPPDLPQDTKFSCDPPAIFNGQAYPAAVFGVYPAAVIADDLDIEPLRPGDPAVRNEEMSTARPAVSEEVEVILIGEELTPEGVIHHRVKLKAPQLVVIPGMRSLPDLEGSITGYAAFRGPRYIWITGVMTGQPKPTDHLILMAACDVTENKATAAPTPSPAEPATQAEYVCPYLQEKARAKAQPAPDAGEVPTVLENLQRLLRAGKLYERGNRYAGRGETERACRCFEQVKKLCPGSPYDAQASAQLLRLKAQNEAREHKVATPTPRARVLDLRQEYDSSCPADAEAAPESGPPPERIQGVVSPGSEEEEVKPAKEQSTPEHKGGASVCPNQRGGFVHQLRDRCPYEFDCGNGQVQCGVCRSGLTCRLVYDGGLVWQCGVVPWLAAVADAVAWGLGEWKQTPPPAKVTGRRHTRNPPRSDVTMP